MDSPDLRLVDDELLDQLEKNIAISQTILERLKGSGPIEGYIPPDHPGAPISGCTVSLRHIEPTGPFDCWRLEVDYPDPDSGQEGYRASITVNSSSELPKVSILPTGRADDDYRLATYDEMTEVWQLLKFMADNSESPQQNEQNPVGRSRWRQLGQALLRRT